MPAVIRSIEELQKVDSRESNVDGYVDVGEGTIWSNPFESPIYKTDPAKGGIHAYEYYFWMTNLPEKLYTLMNKHLLYSKHLDNPFSHASFLLNRSSILNKIYNLKTGISKISLHFLEINPSGIIMDVYYYNEERKPVVRRGNVISSFDIDRNLTSIKLLYQNLEPGSDMIEKILTPTDILAITRA